MPRKKPARRILLSLFIVLAIGHVPVQHAEEPQNVVQTVLYVAPASLGGADYNQGTLESPFLTLEKAKQTVRQITPNMSADVVVYLRNGNYELDEPLVFQAEDSGKNGHTVSYMAYPGEKAVISGGTHILGWILVGNDIYKANAKGIQFRQLFVNGQSRIRARTPNEGSYHRLRYWDETARTIVVSSSDMPTLSSLDGVEMVILKEWTQNNLRLASYDQSGSELHFVPFEPDRTKAFGSLEKKGQSYYFENAFEFLDEEGEWYLKTASDEVFYKPRAGEDVSTLVTVAPKLAQLVRFQGTPTDPVRNLAFVGIAFEHSTWLEPNEEGFASRYADFISKINKKAHTIPGAVHVQNAENIRFEGNVFRNLGGTAIVFWSGVRDSTIIGNSFQDISASAISIGMDLEQHPPESLQICRHIMIKNNFITRVGRNYHSSVGIWAAYTEGVVIENNELVDLPYTGIAVGFGSTSKDTPLKKNLIRRNRVHNVMNLLADGAGIYTVSKQPGTMIIENYVFDIVRSSWAGEFTISGIYLDDYSSLITVSNNLLQNVPIGIELHRADHNLIINSMASFEGRAGSSYNSFIREGDINPDAIRTNAGIDPAYVLAPPATSLRP